MAVLGILRTAYEIDTRPTNQSINQSNLIDLTKQMATAVGRTNEHGNFGTVTEDVAVCQTILSRHTHALQNTRVKIPEFIHRDPAPLVGPTASHSHIVRHSEQAHLGGPLSSHPMLLACYHHKDAMGATRGPAVPHGGTLLSMPSRCQA